MNFPKEIKIGDKEYKVKEKRYLFQYGVGGNIDYHRGVGGIRKGIKGKYKEEVFFHEIAHGVLKDLEFNYPKVSAFRNDEKFVQEMGLILRKTFLDLLSKQKMERNGK